MKRVTIVPKKKAISLIQKANNINSLCYYLTDDYAHFIDLRDRFAGKIEIRNLSGMFQETFQEIKDPFLVLISNLNKEYDSLEWWGGFLASGNSVSTPLLLNITYLFCAKKILIDSHKDVILIVNSNALSKCVSTIAMGSGYQVLNYYDRMSEYTLTIKSWLCFLIHAIYFFWQSLQKCRAAFKLLTPLSVNNKYSKKRVVIRSWITEGTFGKSGEYKDRNFGTLPEWLRSKNYEVWLLPMFFGLSMSITEVYYLMKKTGLPFLIPEHYLKFSDYFKTCYRGYKMFRTRVENAEIAKTDITPLFNEVIKECEFNYSLIILNLCYPMLKRMKDSGYEIDGFYYPFESNPPEKQFILGCRRYFPHSKIIGFQHTTFFQNQLAYHLGSNEKDYHPLPDKIICSGPIYIRLHKEAGFPPEIIEAGPNLRFESVYEAKVEKRNAFAGERKKLMVPLPGLPDHNLVFEILAKVKMALENEVDYEVCIRSHPVLSKKTIVEFVNKINMYNYEFVDDGIIQDWLPQMYAVISMGISVTILEAVTMGIPVVRVIPDNTFFYDPFIWPDYPLEPVGTFLQIRQQLQSITGIVNNGGNIFQEIAKEALIKYFTEPNEENLKVFL